MSVPSRTGKEFLEFDINREWRQGFFGAVSPLSSLNYLPGTRKGLSLSHGKTELLLIIVSIPSLIQQIRWDILQMSRVKTSVYRNNRKLIGFIVRTSRRTMMTTKKKKKQSWRIGKRRSFLPDDLTVTNKFFRIIYFFHRPWTETADYFWNALSRDLMNRTGDLCTRA